MIIFVVLHFLTSFICEARVFCEDTNASPWTPFGYACPVICATVDNAIKRLKIMDYKKTIFQDMIIEPLNDINNVVYNIERSKQTKLSENLHHDSPKFNTHNIYYKNGIKYEKRKDNFYKIHKKYYKNDNIFKSHENIVSKESSNNEIETDNNIYKTPKYDRYYKIDDVTTFVNKMVSLFKMADKNVTELQNGGIKRRFNGDNTFVSIMTNILNKYVSPSFKFTQEMTEVILQKLFNTDVHHNLYDVGELLKYLRKTVHINNNENNYVITLRPRNCMAISLPGCFCKQGFVERSGQCVRPAECLSDESLLQYLDRIIVL